VREIRASTEGVYPSVPSRAGDKVLEYKGEIIHLEKVEAPPPA